MYGFSREEKMKQINVVFEDDEHKRLVRKKGKLTWHDFILKLTTGLHISMDTYKTITRNRYKESLLDSKRIKNVLKYLVKKRLMRPKELEKIIKRFEARCIDKKRVDKAEKDLDIDLTGIKKIYHQYKEEVEIGSKTSQWISLK